LSILGVASPGGAGYDFFGAINRESAGAYGYPSTAEKDEMRAERITVNGKTYEMR
jgi:hypothetical protein